MALQGARELRARLKAIKTVFKPAGRLWADETVRLARSGFASHSKTGKTMASIRRRNASQKRATVVASYPASFIDKGTKAHTIVPRKAEAMKFSVGGRTVFSKKVNKPRTSADPFARRAATEALRRHPILDQLIDLWNRAA